MPARMDADEQADRGDHQQLAAVDVAAHDALSCESGSRGAAVANDQSKLPLCSESKATSVSLGMVACNLTRPGRSTPESNPARRFTNLGSVLRRTRSHGLAICSSDLGHCESRIATPPALRHDYVTGSTLRIMEHNKRWAREGAGRPLFQFVYLMLPTPCNQRCRGCFMGQDKKRLPPHLSGPYFCDRELADIFTFAREHGADAVVYGGGGELFTWKGAFDLIEMAGAFGLKVVVFTNGTLLSREDVHRLNNLGAVLIISLRDTVEARHNWAVGCNGFVKTLAAIDAALAERFHDDNRLAVEIPVTRENEIRVLDDFLPAMRSLGIVPMVEEYIQTCTSYAERRLCHNFWQSRKFFEDAARRDASLGYSWAPEFGQRIVGQPQCMRPLYSFAVFPSGDVMDCPSHSMCYGNMRSTPLPTIVDGDTFKRAVLSFKLCACSVFYTKRDAAIPDRLPEYLEVLV